MSDAGVRRSAAAAGQFDDSLTAAGSANAGLHDVIAALDAPEPLTGRLARFALVIALHAGLIGLVLTIQPRLITDLLPTALNVRTIVEEVKPPEPPKPEVIPPKPLPQAKQVARPPQPAPPVMTAATSDAAPSQFAVAPQPAPVPLAPPAPPAPPAPVAVAPAPIPVTAARFDADYLKNPPPAYPTLSRRMREEGKVLLLVQVSAHGTASNVKVRQSSGFARLDDAAMEAVKQWHFVPAKRGDEAIAASVIVPIVFRIE